MLSVMVIFEEGSNVPPGSPPAPQTGWYAASSSTFALLGPVRDDAVHVPRLSRAIKWKR